MDKNIHDAINAVMKEVGYVRKEKSNGLSYSFAGEAALIGALRPAMVEHGIYMNVESIDEIRREQYTTVKGTQMVNTIVRGSVAFRHTPTDTFIIVQSGGEGSDAGDKSLNKAMTGMYKYALRQTFCIETGDDPDKHSSDEQERAVPKSIKERYNDLLKEAQAMNIDGLEDYALNDKMTDDEIIKLGKELRAKVEKEGK